MEKPSSKPSTANSERELLQTVYLAWSGDMCSKGLEREGGREGERGRGREGEREGGREGKREGEEF